ncbi:MAG: hypothetical protein SFU98_16815 [Leptospiraceae bacterium]|nr:hypothetical protein [Leptospiraceae bacterium]
MTKSKLLQMHNISIVVESLDDTIAFFEEIGLRLEGRAMVEGEWAGKVTGLPNQSVREYISTMLYSRNGRTTYWTC